MKESWKAIAFSMVFAFVLSVIYIFLMSAFAEYLAWGLIFLVEIGVLVIGVGALVYYTQANGSKKGTAALWTGIACLLFFVIFSMLLYCGWKHLKLAIEVVNCSADFLANTKRLLAVPFAYYLLLFMFFLFWVGSMVSVESMGNIKPVEFDLKDNDPPLPLTKEIDWDDRKSLGKTVNLMMAYLTFGLIWFTFFLQASNNYVTMVTASTYYFSSTREKYGSGQILTGVRWAWVTNFGSIAFGSLIIAIIFTIRLMVYYVCKKAEKASGHSRFVKAISCCVQCLLKCLEEIMEYINKQAYAYMAISGESFCTSALNGLMLNLSHGAIFAFANTLAKLFILLGKIGLTVANTVLTYYYIKSTSDDTVGNIYGPMFVVALTTYLLVSVFLGMFDEAVLAMLTCVSIDMDLHGGDNIWGPPTLHDVVDEINGKDPEEERRKDLEAAKGNVLQ